MSVKDKIIRAKSKLYKASPFISYILLHLKLKEDNRIPSMGVTPYGDLLYNREFVKKLSESELKSVLVHETLHIILLHLERGKGKELAVANVAMDLICNDLIVSGNFEEDLRNHYGSLSLKLPSEGLIPENHEFEIWGHKVERINEKSWEEVYGELLKIAPKIKMWVNSSGGNGSKKGSGNGLSDKEQKEADQKLKGFDEHTFGDPTETKSEKKKRVDAMKRIICEAATVAKQQGKLPADIERRVEGLLESKVSWRHRLYRYVVSEILYDYTWSRPSKRSASLGVYLPATLKENVKVVMSIDTSGSMGADDIRDALTELIAIGNSFEAVQIDVVVCDAEVHEHYTLTRENVDDILEMALSGGGGTSHRPIYSYVKEHITDAKVLINATDGYTDFPSRPDDYSFDSIWLITKGGCQDENIPFGEIIRLEEEN